MRRSLEQQISEWEIHRLQLLDRRDAATSATTRASLSAEIGEVEGHLDRLRRAWVRGPQPLIEPDLVDETGGSAEPMSWNPSFAYHEGASAVFRGQRWVAKTFTRRPPGSADWLRG